MSDDTQHLWGIVDMGSNGIRFSVTSVAPPTSRILPPLWQDRAGISLYDAQYPPGATDKQPIPQDTITSVIRALKRFQQTCDDFGVLAKQRRIIATEATRLAVNSDAYRATIQRETGLEVEMLPKEQEGRVGAYGVVASFESVRGVVMDLGGGSTQITWIDAGPPGSASKASEEKIAEVRMSPVGSVSMPYGAAALSRRLAQGPHAVAALRDEMTAQLRAAVQSIAIPKELTQGDGSINLYLSGGGFRGWGFILMSQQPVTPYPIPIINGFRTTTQQFQNTNLVTTAIKDDEEGIFRVSERRASQVPAVALLVGCLVDVLPQIGTVHFAQGGVREGILFKNLPRSVQTEHPMATITRKHATPSSSSIASLLKAAIPPSSNPKTTTTKFGETQWVEDNLVLALAQGMYIHSTSPKDIQAACALRSTTTGILSSVLGADHSERALLAIMLCESCGGAGALAPADESFYSQLVKLLSPVEAWWAVYLGRVAALVGETYPVGVVRKPGKLGLKSSWEGYKSDKTGLDAKKVKLVVSAAADVLAGEVFAKGVKGLEKVGKKKNWVLGTGFKVEVESLEL